MKVDQQSEATESQATSRKKLQVRSPLEEYGFGSEYFNDSEIKSVRGNKNNVEEFLESLLSVLGSKANEESLANFAGWEPPHGPFKLEHPWKEYLKIETFFQHDESCVMDFIPVASFMSLLIAINECVEKISKVIEELLRRAHFKKKDGRRRDSSSTEAATGENQPQIMHYGTVNPVVDDNVEEGDFITIEIDGNVQSIEVVVEESNRVSNNPINARKEEPFVIWTRGGATTKIMEEPVTSKTKGSTISKSMNREFGTSLAGAFDLGAKYLAKLSGKKRPDPIILGILIFIVVVVSSYQTEDILQLAKRRITTILIGVSTVMVISVVILPVWAGEDFVKLVSVNLENLENSLEDLIEVVLTFWDPSSLVFRFEKCEMTRTLAEISGLLHLPYIDKGMIRARNHTGTRFGPLEGFDCFWDEFHMTKEKWERKLLEVFTFALLEHLHAPSLIRPDVIDRCMPNRVKAMGQRICVTKFSLPMGIEYFQNQALGERKYEQFWNHATEMDVDTFKEGLDNPGCTPRYEIWIQTILRGVYSPRGRMMCSKFLPQYHSVLARYATKFEWEKDNFTNSTLASHPYFTRSKAKLAMASWEIKNSLIDPNQDPRKESSECNDEVLRLRQQLIDLHRAWSSSMPPPPLPEDLGNIPNCPPLSQSVPPVTPVFVAPPPSEAPTYVVRLIMVLPRSTSEPVLKVSDNQYYATEPTLRINEPYGYTQPPVFPFDTEKPVATEEQEVIAQKLKSLEQAMRNFQGIEVYKSVSYKYLCMFPDVNLPLGFKMTKFEKYAWHGDPMAHLRHYCNQLRAAGGREELLMAFFGKSLSDLALE
ncbi:hypothetical protein FXO37_07248 [Capsicum annuum]|nr:hypothetical protein FXO37_07248 [Capsicum annuum]